MKPSATWVLAAALLAGCGAFPDRDVSSSRVNGAPHERQILLTVRQEQPTALGLAGASKHYVRRRGYGPTPVVERTLNQLAKEHGLERVDGWPIASLDVYCAVFVVPEDVAVGDVIDRLAVDPRVDIAQPMNIFETLGTLGSGYDDPYANLQSAVVHLEIEPAHQFATGKGVMVAVIDSAVDTKHPDLRGRVGVAHNLVSRRVTLKTAEIHGTAVAGIIASIANNTEGIVGVAPDVKIAALRACWSVAEQSAVARCSSFSLAQALEVALRIQPQIINLSLAGPSDLLLSRLLDQAIARGIVVVAAKPEAAHAENSFPASHARVIVADSATQGAAPITDPADSQKAASAISSSVGDSDWRSTYLLAAPATEILTTTPNGSYAFLSGNSLAAAHVSGVIALLMERESGMAVDRIAALLADSTTHTSGLRSISACRALERLINIEVCARQAEAVVSY